MQYGTARPVVLFAIPRQPRTKHEYSTKPRTKQICHTASATMINGKSSGENSCMGQGAQGPRNKVSDLLSPLRLAQHQPLQEGVPFGRQLRLLQFCAHFFSLRHDFEAHRGGGLRLARSGGGVALQQEDNKDERSIVCVVEITNWCSYLTFAGHL